MNRRSIYTRFLGVCAATSIAIGVGACSTADDADGSDESAEGELRSGHAACVGYGWKNQILDWKGVKGTYQRRGAPVAGEFSSLTVSDDPSALDGGLPAYEREIDGETDTGKIVLGVDNPAIGPAIYFPDSSLDAKDIYWVLGQKRNRKGELVGICLAQGGTREGENTTQPDAFMLERKR